jgi:hypothetical protein
MIDQIRKLTIRNIQSFTFVLSLFWRYCQWLKRLCRLLWSDFACYERKGDNISKQSQSQTLIAFDRFPATGGPLFERSK